MSSELVNPFVGPQSLIRGQNLYGRERETRELFYLLTAERIVWLHSPSGAGKTSLINAGLIPRLERDGFDVYPTIRVNLDIPDRSDRYQQTTNRYLLSTLISLEERLTEARRRSHDELATLSLSEYLATGSDEQETESNIVLVFDQFEEILTIDPLQVEQKRCFFQEVGNALRQRNNIWALFSLREEFLAQLDPYIDYIPTRWNNTFRLALLGKQAMIEVVTKTAKDGGREFTDAAAKALFADLAKTQVQQPDGSFEEQTGQHVEPVQLQVVCRRLWDEMPADDLRIDPEDIRQFGDVSEALGAYYDNAVVRIAGGDLALERSMRRWFSKRLITASGIRGQVLRGEGTSEGLDNELIKQLVDTHLVRGEKRAGATWYELAHDRLIQPVVDSNTTWSNKNLQPFQRLTMAWAEQGRPSNGGNFRLKGRVLWTALKWQRNHPHWVDEDERKLLEISRKAWKWQMFIGFMTIMVINALMYSWNQTQLAKHEATEQKVKAERAEQAVRAQNKKLQRQLAMMDWNNGFNERDADNGDPLKALHYLARAAEGFTHINDIGLSNNALLAHKFVQGGMQLQGVIKHKGIVQGAVFSTDGQRILTWSWDGTARLWNSQSGEPLTGVVPF